MALPLHNHMMFDGQGVIYQNAYVVDNLDAAISNWVRLAGAGPFFVLRNLSSLKIEYHGAPSSMEISLAIGQAGSIHVELIQVHSTNPCVYTDLYPAGSFGGFHHVGMLAVDFEPAVEAYQSAGHPIAMKGVFGSTPFAYIDTRSALGFFTEFHEDTPEIRRMFRMIAEASRAWDGTDPIRPLM